jgi:hypothetical protein
VQTQGPADTAALIASLEQAGFGCLDLSGNELAKLHLRHMVGGRLPASAGSALGLGQELLYRFEFPERPGALMAFVNSLQASWNISIFHYRNHGADVGRIVVGVQVPPAEREQWQDFLAHLAYRYWDETANPAYALFLGDRQPALPALLPGQLADNQPVGQLAAIPALEPLMPSPEPTPAGPEPSFEDAGPTQSGQTRSKQGPKPAPPGPLKNGRTLSPARRMGLSLHPPAWPPWRRQAGRRLLVPSKTRTQGRWKRRRPLPLPIPPSRLRCRHRWRRHGSSPCRPASRRFSI